MLPTTWGQLLFMVLVPLLPQLAGLLVRALTAKVKKYEATVDEPKRLEAMAEDDEQAKSELGPDIRN